MCMIIEKRLDFFNIRKPPVRENAGSTAEGRIKFHKAGKFFIHIIIKKTEVCRSGKVINKTSRKKNKFKIR